MAAPDALETLLNWAGNVTFAPAQVAHPTSLDELVDVVTSGRRVHVLGTGHSFSRVADTDGVLVLLDRMPRVVEIDTASSTVLVSAQTRWGELVPAVHGAGLALHNMGSLPHISVAGSASTGTHGSGSRLGCLATAVRALEIVRADGSTSTVHRGDRDFPGSVVALGGQGVVTSMTLDLVPGFDVEQTVWESLPFDIAAERFDDVMDSACSVSLFTTWRSDIVEQVWVKRRTDEPDADLAWTGATRAEGPRHPVPGGDPAACTTQGGVPGPWHERLPHFRLEFTPSSGDELQTEYMVPRSVAAHAIQALRSLREIVAPVLQISEIRTVAPDDLWLSPSQGRDTVCLHFTWVADAASVAPVVRTVEAALAPFSARPHWGKVFSTEPDVVRSLYPHWEEARALRDRLDPDGVFANPFTDTYLPRS
jgi:xylitol oxidase